MGRGAWWAAVHGVTKSWTQLSDFTFTFHCHALEKEMATHSSVLAWRIPGVVRPGGLPSMGSHRGKHDWSDLAAAADQGKCSQLGEVVGWIFWSGGDASCTPQVGGDDEYALGLRRISILASWSGRDTSYALQLGRVTDWGPCIREATGSTAIPQDRMCCSTDR